MKLTAAKVILGFGGVLVLLMLLFPPWDSIVVGNSFPYPRQYRWFHSPPPDWPFYRINDILLTGRIVGVALLSAGLGWYAHWRRKKRYET